MKKNNSYLKDEIDLEEITKTLWREKILILSISLIFMVAGYVYGALQPKIYKTEIIVNDLPLHIFKNYNSFYPLGLQQQQQQQQQQQSISREFNNEMKLSLVSLNNLLQFYENNNKINVFKTYLKEKNINARNYFNKKINFNKDKNINFLNTYSLTYSLPLPGENFLNEYIIYTQNQVLLKYKRYLIKAIENEINVYKQQYDIAKKIDLENPILKSLIDGRSLVNEPTALFYKGTKVLSQNIIHLNLLLNDTKNLILDYNPIFEQASPSALITKPPKIYATIALLLGLFSSLMIVFIRSAMHR